MEYLMTYGWAILIVIIVAAALYALGVFNPATWTGTRSTGFANIGQPTDWQYATNGTFYLTLKNSLGSQITINSVKVECGTDGTIVDLAEGGWPATVGAGGTIGMESNGTTICAQMSPGGSYSTKVSVIYTKAGGAYTQTDTGTVTGTVA